MCPHAGQRAQGPHWAGNPASIRSILHAHAPQPELASVNALTSSHESAPPELIAILMVEASTLKQLHMTRSSSWAALSVSCTTWLIED